MCERHKKQFQKTHIANYSLAQQQTSFSFVCGNKMTQNENMFTKTIFVRIAFLFTFLPQTKNDIFILLFMFF